MKMFLKAKNAKFVAVMVLFVALVTGTAFAVPSNWFNDVSFKPIPGSYSQNQTVKIYCGRGYEYEYSFDGTTWIKGTTPFTTIVLDTSKTIYARIADKRPSGGPTGPGRTVTGVYTVVTPAPTATPAVTH